MPRKLTKQQADEVRELYSKTFSWKAGTPGKWTLEELSYKYNMHYSTIWKIIKNRTYNDG